MTFSDSPTPARPRRMPFAGRAFGALPVRFALGFAVAALSAGEALAQYGGPGMMPGMPQGPRPGTGGGGDDGRPEGPAEAAPDADRDDDELAPLAPMLEAERRRTQLVELDGYFRFRTDWLHQLHLGQGYVVPDGQAEPDGTPPFPTPLECGLVAGKCGTKTLGSANLRLRLEPTVNVSDQVRVMAQIDVLDNTIAGSTPDSLVQTNRLAQGTGAAPLPVLYNTQYPPDVGRNGWGSSVQAKRAWGEIDSEFGSIRFGRMPWHFGRGLMFNNGNCLDCDIGTTVDRVMALSMLWGHEVAVAWDYGAQGHTSNMSTLGVQDPFGTPFDLSQKDDVFQLMAALSRRDDPERFRFQATRGELALNYAAQLVYRNNSGASRPLETDTAANPETPTDGQAFSPGELSRPEVYVQNVNAYVFIPSVWFKLGWRALTVEFEADAMLGKIGNPGDLNVDNRSLSIQQLGWVFASDLALFKNALYLGLETGGASGDRAEPQLGNGNNTYLNYRWRQVQQQAGDNNLTNFHFSPDYHVDQILFRRIFGTVTNAIYVKPQIAYWLTIAEQRQLGLTASVIYSAAAVRLGTPGDARNLGLEMNVGLTYRNPADRFFAGLTWAVLWPFAALNRPSNENDQPWPRGTLEDASSAQVIRGFLGIQF